MVFLRAVSRPHEGWSRAAVSLTRNLPTKAAPNVEGARCDGWATRRADRLCPRNGWPLLSAIVVNQQNVETGDMEPLTLKGFAEAARALGYAVRDGRPSFASSRSASSSGRHTRHGDFAHTSRVFSRLASRTPSRPPLSCRTLPPQVGRLAGRLAFAGRPPKPASRTPRETG